MSALVLLAETFLDVATHVSLAVSAMIRPPIFSLKCLLQFVEPLLILLELPLLFLKLLPYL